MKTIFTIIISVLIVYGILYLSDLNRNNKNNPSSIIYSEKIDSLSNAEIDSDNIEENLKEKIDNDSNFIVSGSGTVQLKNKFNSDVFDIITNATVTKILMPLSKNDNLNFGIIKK